MTSRTVSVGTFNILADGMSSNEFLCPGGDQISTDWKIREGRVLAVLVRMLQRCDVVVTQENDHFPRLLHLIRTEMGMAHIAGVLALKAEPKKPSNARSLKIHKLFLSMTNDLQCRPNPKDREHEEHYKHCNDIYKSTVTSLDGDMLKSFEEECAGYGSFYSRIYDSADATDLYRSDDGIGVFYNTDKLSLIESSIPGNIEMVPHISPCGTLRVFSSCSFVVRCLFAVHGVSDTFLNLYGAHLKSGESWKGETERVQQLSLIFDHILMQSQSASTSNRIDVIAMDSNNSAAYEAAYTSESEEALTLSKLISSRGYKDAVALTQSITECFKMRHGFGDQPAKLYMFMFDTIDKILVPSVVTVKALTNDEDIGQTENFGYKRYDPNNYELFHKIRNDFDFRRRLESAIRRRTELLTRAMTSDAEVSVPDEVAEELAYFGVDTTNDAILIAQGRQSVQNGQSHEDILKDSVAIFSSQHPLSGLYPNPDAPSDHPPIAVSIEL